MEKPFTLYYLVKREKPPHDNQRGGFPPLADVLDSERPIDRLPPEIRHVRPPPLTNGHSLSTADLRSTNALTNRDAVIRGRIEVMTELSPDKDAAMETDKRNPFRLPGDEERARTLLSAPWNVQGGLWPKSPVLGVVSGLPTWSRAATPTPRRRSRPR